jgi:CoA:oxalate CoA-transferase
MFDCQLALLENAIMRYTVEGEIPGPLGARHPTITPFQAFKTADGAIIIAAGNDGLFVKMCEALGLSGLATAPTTSRTRCGRSITGRSSMRSNRCSRARRPRTGSRCSARPACRAGRSTTWRRRSPIRRSAARNMLVEVPDGSGGTLKLAGNPLKMSAFADPRTRRAAPDLDADRAGHLSV